MFKKSLLFMLLMAIFAPWAAKAQTTGCAAIGEESTSYGSAYDNAGYVPIDTYYKYSYEQMVYDGSEMPTTITSISFKYKSNYAMTEKDDVAIYLGETTSATLTSWMSADNLTLVYSGAMDFPASPDGAWVEFTFNQNGGSFSHDQSKYIVVVVNDKSYGYPTNYSYMYFCYQPCASGVHLYAHNDNSGAYSVSPSSSGTSSAYCPTVRFCGTFPVVACPKPKNLSCTATTGTPTTATFTWTNGGTETDWVLEYGTASDFTGATSIAINESELVSGAYTLTTGLTAETKYYARLKADCGGEESDWSNTVDFKPTNTIPLTVYDNESGTSSTIPMYGNYFDDYTKSECIIPATELTAMTDGKISAITFYASSIGTNSTTWSNTNQVVFIKEVAATTLDGSFSGTDGATTVFDGILPMPTTSDDGYTIEFPASVDYTYNGGNLLIGVYNTDDGTYNNVSWKGKSGLTSGVSAYGNNSSSLSGVTYSAQTFLPKTTFTYLPTTTPKPKNLSIVENSLSSSGVTLQWQAPTTATPTGYEYQYKVSAGEWPAVWTTASGLTAPLSGLTATTDYTFRVRANYAEGNSDPVKIEFTTLDNCAIPTGFAATTIPGQGTKATFSWTKGFVDDDDWVLQYGTDNTFTTCTEITDGFTVEGNTVSFAATTGITAEQLHYARVRTDCGGTYSTWSNVAEFTPSNYVDFHFRETASSTSNYNLPFYYNTTYTTNQSQFVIPATELVDLAGGAIRSITYYTSNTTISDWGGVAFDVYLAEVENTTFSSATFVEWTTLTKVYSGTVSLNNGKMTIVFDDDYDYGGGNLLIGFQNKTAGTSTTSMSWTAYYGSTYYGVYQNGSNSATISYYQPKITLNYLPTAYPRVAEVITGTITGTSAQLSWAAPSENVTGYKYQYKVAGEEWPTAWTSTIATSVTLTTEPTTNYEFQVKAVYGTEESVATTKSFSTPCLEAYPVPYTYDFEEAKPFTCWTVASGGSVTREYSTSTGYTHSGTYYMCFKGSQTNEIEMPSFAVATNTLRLEFWVRPENYTNSNCGSFAVGYYNSSNEFVALKTYAFNSTSNKYDGWESSTYKKEHIDFDDPGVPADANIIFRQFGTTNNWYWFIDDVKVKVIPTCEDVDNVHCASYTNHSATIAWDAIAGQSAWQIAYKAGANFNPNDATELATATVVDVTANPYLFDKTLVVGTTYYMYVRANCTASSDGYGDWSDSYATFTTKEATPAPSSFTASNLGSHQVDLKWTAGGGDYEESWDLYYVPSASAPEAPTAETPASKTVTTLPTNEAPYVLTGLTASSRYYIWVRSNHENNTHSGWVALTGDYFETLDACPTPTGLATSNLTSVSADLNWVGSSDVTSYTVQYRLLEEGTVYLNEGFEHSGNLPDGWDNSNSTSTSYKWKIGAGAGATGSSSTNNPVKTAANGDYNINYYCSTSSNYARLITPKMDLSGVGIAKLTFKYTNPIWSSGRYALTISYRVAEGEWHDIITFTDNKEEWVNKEVVLEGMDDNYQIGFYVKGYNNDYGYGMGVDDVKVFEVGGTWLTASDNVETQAYTLSGLTPANEYQTRVKSNCTSGEYCEPATFTTLADGNKVFTNATNDGKWGTAGNWAPSNAPALTDNVIVRANATIESGCVAQANKITFEGATTPTLTIADGGQLITNTAVTATVQKTINAAANWSTNSEGWYFIAQPITTYQIPSTLGLITDSYGSTVSNADATYDLYKLDPTNNKWSNYRSSSFSLDNGYGYLYASKAGLTINFNGTINHNTSKDVTVYEGWNLVGNPFTYNAYINTPYYVMKADGTLNAEEQSSGTIAPCTAVAVEAAADGKVIFSKEAPSGAKGGINIALTEANTLEKVMDNAIVSFNNNKLGKFYFGSQDANIYIPQDGKDYAIVDAEAQGETPVNFKAAKNGTYTLLFNTEGVTMGYLHLIDNMTGNDVDLLANPSYSFDAKTTDYASRFKLVFATGNADDDSFAFISNGEIILNGVNGNTTVQVYDVTGRMVISTNGANRISIDNMAAGVYMLRLINGDTVKTQKIVVK